MEFIDPYTLLIYRPDSINVWHHDLIKERLNWYYSVMRDEKPAKFIIAKHVPIDIDPYHEGSIEDLWSVHKKAEKEFQKIFNAIRGDKLSITELEKPRYSFLDVKIVIARKILELCSLCERRCHVNRLKGEMGVCHMDRDCIVHSYFHHMGEEAPLVPSGTIFYGGCNLKCRFCQNYDISQVYPRHGIKFNSRSLAKIQEELRRTGARNINHVGGDPTPHLPFILESFRYLEVNVPQLWNSNMYLTTESMELLKDVIDIWLPDFKYGNDECAKRLSLVPRYFEVVTRNLEIAYRNGDMIIRHLVLPNHIDCCTKPILEWIAKHIPKAIVNIMDQYRPEHIVARQPEKYPDIARRPTHKEINRTYKIAKELGFTVNVTDLWIKP